MVGSFLNNYFVTFPFVLSFLEGAPFLSFFENLLVHGMSS